MPEKPRRILLGRIAGAHGIRGGVLIRTFTQDPRDVAAYGPLTDADGGRSFTVKVERVTDKGVIARFPGISDRNGAEALKGVELYATREQLPPPEEGAFYHADLVGLRAVDPAGTVVGEVVAVHNHGAGDILEIARAADHGTELVPFTHATAPEVDLAGGRIVIVLPESGADEPSDEGDEAESG